MTLFFFFLINGSAPLEFQRDVSRLSVDNSFRNDITVSCGSAGVNVSGEITTRKTILRIIAGPAKVSIIRQREEKRTAYTSESLFYIAANFDINLPDDIPYGAIYTGA